MHVDRLLTLALLGRHAEAAAEAEPVAVKAVAKSVRFRLACMYGACYSAVAENRWPDALTDEDKALQKAYYANAIDILERAVSNGFDDWAMIRSDPDLAILRDDPRFHRVFDREKKVK